jgi:pyruvate kinase
MLSGETSYGKYPIEVIKTLDRVCKNIEKNVIHELQVNESREHTKINFSGKPVAAVIAQSAVEMAYILKASAILLMTVTVGTATKISKLRAPCQILAVTQNG